MTKFLLCLALLVSPVMVTTGFTGCSTGPSERVVAVQSLLAVGQSAEAAVTLSAQLFRDGKISAAQAQTVIDYYDTKFQPVYRLAVTAAKSDLSKLASPDLINLSTGLAVLVVELTKPKAP